MKSLKWIIITLAFYSCSSENESNIDRQVKPSGKIDPHVNKNIANGKVLFQDSCAQCHGVNQKIIAAPFQAIREDYELEWIFRFIRNNDSLIKSGDVRANYVFELNNQLMMPRFTSLTNQQINDILEYVDTFPIVYNYYEHRKIPTSVMKDSIRVWRKLDKKMMKETLKSIRSSE